MARSGTSSRLESLVERGRRSPDEPLRLAISGRAGSGLTEALDTLAAVLDEVGVEVLRLRGRAGEEDQALGALESIVDVADERVAREALLARLEGGAALLVDEAHWLDGASARVLLAVAERMDERSFGLVVAYRRTRVDPALAAVLAVLARHGPPCLLESLEPDEAGERLARLLDAPTGDDLVAALLWSSGGHALWFDLLARSWRDEGVIDRGSLVEEPTRASGPLVEQVRLRLEVLPGDSRSLLSVLSSTDALDDAMVCELTGVEAGRLGSLVEVLDDAGVLGPEGRAPVPLVAEVVRRVTPEPELRRLHGRVAELLERRGAPAARVAGHLRAAGVVDPGAGEVFARAGDELLEVAPSEARAWYRSAETAGVPLPSILPRLARAEALTGDPADALALADRALSLTQGAELAHASETGAALLAARGAWEPARRLVEQAGHASGSAAVVVALLGLRDGDPTALERARALANGPSLGAEVVRLMVEGLARSIAPAPGSVDEVVRPLVDAADLLEERGTSDVLAESPHALAAVIALHGGDLPLADQLLDRAVDRDVGGPVLRTRHRLLAAWSALRAGRWSQAEDLLDECADQVTWPRDRLLAVAVGSGLARRSGDVAALAAAWRRAEPVVVDVAPDLTAVEPLGELEAAAARLDTWERIVDRRSELRSAIDRLDAPPLWALPDRWASVQSAVAASDVDRLELASALLRAVVEVRPAGDALEVASRAWACVIGDDVQLPLVDEAAASLDRLGLSWEASRLVGQAAVRVEDAGLTRALLGRARDLRGAVPVEESAGTDALAGLSEREQEVAGLVADGLTYKEIGAQLFISPKTVEHHVAKIRQKLGAETRAEMLAALRQA